VHTDPLRFGFGNEVPNLKGRRLLMREGRALRLRTRGGPISADRLVGPGHSAWPFGGIAGRNAVVGLHPMSSSDQRGRLQLRRDRGRTNSRETKR